jgi:uncharacterized membrane protein (UPF0127 family)
MTKTVMRLALVSVLALAGCDDAGDDHRPPPGREGAGDATASPVPQSPDDPAPVPTVPPLHPSVDDYPEALVTLADRVTIPVKVADDVERREHGLMEVEDLPPGTGMLFVFDGERTGGFWMKNTLVPLDIAYADADGEIVSILAMEPCVADPCEVYDPGAAYQRALEVPQGWFAEVGVEVGDLLEWEPLERDG